MIDQGRIQDPAPLENWAFFCYFSVFLMHFGAIFHEEILQFAYFLLVIFFLLSPPLFFFPLIFCSFCSDPGVRALPEHLPGYAGALRHGNIGRILLLVIQCNMIYRAATKI